MLNLIRKMEPFLKTIPNAQGRLRHLKLTTDATNTLLIMVYYFLDQFDVDKCKNSKSRNHLKIYFSRLMVQGDVYLHKAIFFYIFVVSGSYTYVPILFGRIVSTRFLLYVTQSFLFLGNLGSSFHNGIEQRL